LIPEVWDAPDSIIFMVSPAAAPAVATPARVFLRKANVRPELESLPPISSTNQVLVMGVPRGGIQETKEYFGTVYGDRKLSQAGKYFPAACAIQEQNCTSYKTHRESALIQ
jgi:hypothetical protein